MRALVVTTMYLLPARPALTVKARHRVVTLHGNDHHHPRSRRLTTAVLGRMDLIGAPTAGVAAAVPGAGKSGRPVAILPEAMRGVAGTHCGERDRDGSREALAPHLAASDPHVRGHSSALELRSGAIAQRVADAWRRLASGGQAPPLYSPAEAPTEALRGAPPS